MKQINYILIFLIVSFFYGCADFEELNQDPTKSGNMDPGLLIPTIQMRQSENHHDWTRYLSYPAGFMQQWTGAWSTVEFGGRGQRYSHYMEHMWNSYYPVIIRDIVDVVVRTNDLPEKANINSIGRILRVECFQKLTDTYGNIPYSEAGYGASQLKFMPKYDMQEDIYADMLKELKEAAAALGTGEDEIKYDLYYDGDLDKWRKFANSLRLRLAMRLIKVDPARAKAEAEAAIAAGVLQSNDDICYVKHENYLNPTSGLGKGNGLAIRLFYPEDPQNNPFRISRELIEVMEEGQDPRLLWYGGIYHTDPSRTDITALVRAQNLSYADMALPAQQFPWDFGLWLPPITIELNGRETIIESMQQRLQPSKYITALDAPFIHLSYAEVKFLMAEAAVRGWNIGSGTAESHYNEAMEAAVMQWSLFGVTDFDRDAIETFKQSNKLITGSELMQINTQMWVLLFLDPFETWSNWRRTGMPALVFKVIEPSKNHTNGQFPRRLEYPLEEQMKNATHYREALEYMGGEDSWLNRVWWDKE